MAAESIIRRQENLSLFLFSKILPGVSVHAYEHAPGICSVFAWNLMSSKTEDLKMGEIGWVWRMGKGRDLGGRGVHA